MKPNVLNPDHNGRLDLAGTYCLRDIIAIEKGLFRDILFTSRPLSRFRGSGVSLV